MQTVAIIDIGKTNVKLALVDPARGVEIAVLTQPNTVRPGPPWPHFDTDAQWAFLTEALRRMARDYRIDGIAVTTHGACGAVLDAQGELAAPVLDYEHDGPDAFRADYDAIRPDFSETGSPGLAHGLNLGAQLHFMLRADPTLRDRIAHVVTWPQYWGFRLTGQLACDVCSLGAHTDLWNPHLGTWSALPDRLGLADRMAPARKPDEVLGTLTPALQADLGLGPVPVLVGIHDSNASLLPHLGQRSAPFSVVSTGTWVIAMAIGGDAVALDPARDTLMNVNALGQPVPSARFMGGREFDLIRGASTAPGTDDDAAQVLARGVMLLPAVVPDCGPFQGRAHRWTLAPDTEGQRAVGLGWYLALVAAESLSVIGAQGPSLIEGPFAANPWFLQMLATATGRDVIPSQGRTGTAIGAALLFGAGAGAAGQDRVIQPDPRLAGYVDAWRARSAG
jgi:sugar (pentulose or hexulose) kinase